MMPARPFRRAWRRASTGVAAIELALVLPFFLILIMGVVDCARAIQATMILINLSRETANLASRGSLALPDSSQTILTSVASTAPPLDMNGRGMLYITKIMGHAASGSVRNYVLEQYRWDDSVNHVGWSNGQYGPASKVWHCGLWASGGRCSAVPKIADATPVTLMDGQLADGEVIYVAEAFYNFNMFFGSASASAFGLPLFGPDLYSITVF